MQRRQQNDAHFVLWLLLIFSTTFHCNMVYGYRRESISTISRKLISLKLEHSGLQSSPSRRSLARLLSSSIETGIIDDGAATISASSLDIAIPTRGLLPYDPKDMTYDAAKGEVLSLPFAYNPPTFWQTFFTRFALWRQVPWKKIKGKVMLKMKLGGSLSVQDEQVSLFSPIDKETVSTLTDLTSLCLLGAHDPRVQGLYVDITALSCGYAKLDEAIRWIQYFRQSGKPVIGYATRVSEKEYYLSRAFSEFYLPPLDGSIDLRGFSSNIQFLRGVFNKVGVEPQVLRIGKYKSFGDTYLREDMSDAQREVVTSILRQASDRWLVKIAHALNQSVAEVASLWSDTGVKDTYYYQVQKKLVNGVMYVDQVEEMINHRYGEPPKLSWWKRLKYLFASKSDEYEDTQKVGTNYDLFSEFQQQPRRSFPSLSSSTPPVTHTNNKTDTVSNQATSSAMADEEKSSNETSVIAKDLNMNIDTSTAAASKASQAQNERKPKVQFYDVQSYLSRMKRKGTKILKAVPIKFTSNGERIAVVSAVGSIVDGKSSTANRNIGAQSLIPLLRQVKDDSGIRAVVLQIDSPGGSASASDLVWREIRNLAKVKPVVACMVDVAASGGYYFAMACDQIVADELTLTGSIGIVFAKFNANELLTKKIGLNTETLSIGRYADLLLPTRGFTEEEQLQFEELGQKGYKTFVEKAAASRSMAVADMQEVAQGRVWTGQQAKQKGLVDHIGGLWDAVDIADKLAEIEVAKKKGAEGSSSNNKKSEKDQKKTKVYRVEMVKEKKASGLLGKLSGIFASSSSEIASAFPASPMMALASEEIFASNLACGHDSLGGHPALSQFGVSPALTNLLKLTPAFSHIPSLIVASPQSRGNLMQEGLSLLKAMISK